MNIRFRFNQAKWALEDKIHARLHSDLFPGGPDHLLKTAEGTLHSIASMTVFDDTKDTYEFCLDEARKMATETLDLLNYKCNCPRR
jgi:hypothetical protein